MPDQFSITRGGPLDRALNRIGITTTARRVAISVLVAWVPLPVIAYLVGVPSGSAALRLLLLDYPTYARFLLAVPLFWLAEPVVETRLRAVVRHFRDSGLVRPADRTVFDSGVESLSRTTRSPVPELLLLILAFSGALLLPTLRPQAGEFESHRFLLELINRSRPVILWFTFISIPIYNFLFYRWVWRLLVWGIFLVRVSRLNLRLTASHPDLAGGLAFLPVGQLAFWYIALAEGCIVSAILAQRILLGLESLTSAVTTAGVYIAIAPVIILLPLTVFVPKLVRLKISGLMDHGTLSNRYTSLFEERWIGKKEDDELLGTPDLQSLADLGSSFEVVRRMRVVPFGSSTVLALVASAAAPLLPLVLIEIPFIDVVEKLARALF